MELFLDNDIILKLSSINLLKKIESIFNVQASSIYILPSAIGFISNSKRVKEKYSSQAINNAISVIKDYQIIPDHYVDQNKFIQLSDINKIDSGEKILFSITPQSDNFLLLTGDKNSIQALAERTEIQNIKEYLKHKIISLEKIFLMLLDNEQFDELVEKIILSNFCGDIALKLIFNQHNVAIEKIKEGLLSYYTDLKTKSQDLLY